MSAKRYDNPLRYTVDSHSDEDTDYLVEIDAHDGNGRCTCPHFEHRLSKMIALPGAQPSDATRCHHINEAREKFINDVIAAIKQRQRANGTAKRERSAA